MTNMKGSPGLAFGFHGSIMCDRGDNLLPLESCIRFINETED